MPGVPTIKVTVTLGTATAKASVMIEAGPNEATQEKLLQMQILKARQVFRQSERKVEAIEASIHKIEKFYPKIKILRSPAPLDSAPENILGTFGARAFVKAA